MLLHGDGLRWEDELSNRMIPGRRYQVVNGPSGGFYAQDKSATGFSFLCPSILARVQPT